MNKKFKIILTTVISILVLIIVYIILIIKGILPNPFLDTKDLVCTIFESYEDSEETFERISKFKFDNKAIIVSYEVEEISTYSSIESANKNYEYINEEKYTYVEKKENVIHLISTYEIEENKGYYGKTKKEIKEMYEKNFLYECK